MKNTIIVLVLCLVVLSCNRKNKPEKPDNLISQDNMELILYDLYVINAAKGVNRKLLEDRGIVPETYILNKHKIDSTQFAESNAYYAFDPDLYKSMVEKIKAKLEKQKEAFEDTKKTGKAVNKKKDKKLSKRMLDSLNKFKKRRKDSMKKALTKKVIN